MRRLPALVSSSWLREQLQAARSNVRVLDASWYLPSMERDARREFEHSRIPSAQFFDLDANSDHTSTLPHMLPTEDAFARSVESLGITSNDTVIVYDKLNIFSSARCWFMFRVFGHRDVAVLDGGFPAWTRHRFPVDTDPPSPPPPVVKMHDVMDRLHAGATLLDARSRARFEGTAPEPRPIPAGHIPLSTNVPFTETLEQDGTMKSPQQLQDLFARAAGDAGFPHGKDVIVSCGSGVTACVLALALEAAYPRAAPALYDGSWSEWADQPANPIHGNGPYAKR